MRQCYGIPTKSNYKGNDEVTNLEPKGHQESEHRAADDMSGTTVACCQHLCIARKEHHKIRFPIFDSGDKLYILEDVTLSVFTLASGDSRLNAHNFLYRFSKLELVGRKGKPGHFQLVETFQVCQELHPRERAECAVSISAFDCGHSKYPETVHVSTDERNTSAAKPRCLCACLDGQGLQGDLREQERPSV